MGDLLGNVKVYLYVQITKASMHILGLEQFFMVLENLIVHLKNKQFYPFTELWRW